MKLIKFDDASQYYRRIESYLLLNEAVNCLLLATSLNLCNSDRHKASYLALVEDNRAILATAIHIRDYAPSSQRERKLLLSKSTSLEAVELIAKDLAVDCPSVPGITAPQAEVETFVTAWKKLTGQSVELKMTMQIQQLRKLKAIDYAAGQLKLAIQAETELLTKWIQAFVKEALGIDESEADSRRWVIRHLEQDSLYVWENNNRLVSMAAYGGITPNGIRVNSVYTPLEHRGNGYATSCVAAMSKVLLHRHRYCFLFTDKANLTSYKIYHRIGYTPMGDISDYKFINE